MLKYKLNMFKKSSQDPVDFLAELLSAKQPLFKITLEDLEDITQQDQLDSKLQKDVEKSFAKFVQRELELEIDDASGEEVYKALMLYIWEQNDLVLTKYLKQKKDASLDQVLTACINFVLKMNLPKTVFKLKKSKAKAMLKANPPEQIMQLLGYEKVEDLIKFEKLEEVYGALRFAEGDIWLDKFNEQYRHLKPEDFTKGKIEIVKMPLRWAPLTKKFIAKKRHNITHLKELGVVLVLETKDEELRHGLVLKALPLIVHYFYEIHLYSSFFKLQAGALKGEKFGRVLEQTISADPKLNLKIAGEHVHWRVIQRYFGKLEDANKHPEIFEPHLQPEDLHWDHAEKALAHYIPELMVWEDLDYVAKIYDDKPISLNLMDVTLSFANKNRYGDHLVYHFRESLWNEIFARYMSHENLEDELLAKLNNSLVMPEKLPRAK